MKKVNILRLVCSFVLITILSSCISVKAYSTNNEVGFNTLKEAFIDEFGDDYMRYLEDNYYELSVAQKVEKLLKEENGDSYPDFYGGMYISEDSKNLIIQIVKEKVPEKNTNKYKLYEKMINIDDTIIVESVKHSFNELSNVRNLVSKCNINNNNFNSMYIDVFNNNVVIELLNNTPLKQQDFINNLSIFNTMSVSKNDKLFDPELIEFKQGVINEHTSSNNSLYDMKPGQSIAVPGGSCSMGFRTKYNGQPGYMTAGHCVMIDETNTTLTTGKVKVFQYANQQVGDYAFVQTSTYTPLNIMKFGMNNLDAYQMELIVTSAPTLVAGTAIAKEGATTKYTAGKITAPSFDAYHSSTGKTIKGLVKSDLLSAKGDSGGVVFIPKTNFTAIPIGILSGGNEGAGLMYFTNINSLPYALRSGRY